MTLRPFAIIALMSFVPLLAAPAARAETVAPQSVQSVDRARLAALSDTMKMAQVMSVMRDEGLDYGQTLEDEMFAGRGGDRWQAVVGAIYNADQMRARFDAGMAEALSDAGEDLARIEAFFGSDQGQNILTFEIEARRALLDSEVEDAAKVAWADMEAEGGPRVDMLRRFVAANDLIESNVMGALNANLAFYRGLAETGAFPEEMTEEQMLQEVWAQEPQIRAETESWLFPYLALAYQPLPDADLEAYTLFSESAAGRRMNTALFAAFDKVFTQISEDLGRAAARQMQGEDI